MKFSSIDLHYLIEEMKFLVGGRVDKVYHPRKEELLIQFHVPSKGKQMLRIIPGKYAFLTEFKGRYDTPGGFCMFLRKNLENRRLRGIRQEGSERILVLEFDDNYLYVELFGKGNVVITDKSNKILNALFQQKWKDRIIKKDEEYRFPKKGFDLFKIGKEEFISLLKSDNELVMKLAKDIGLGGVYSEEICLISKVDKKKKRLEDNEIMEIWKAFKSIREGKIEAYAVYKDEIIKQVIPRDLKVYEGMRKEKIKSISSGYDIFFKEEFKEEFVSKHQSNIDKALKIIKQQEKGIKEMEDKAEEDNRKGEIIYEKYQLIDEILKEVNKAREKYSFKEIKEKLKGHKVVKDVDEKDKKIVVEI